MALSSAVLTAESHIFRFRAFCGPNTRTDFGDGRPIFTEFQDVMAQASAQNNFMLRFQNITPFWNGPSPIGTRVDKKTATSYKRAIMVKPLNRR